MPLPPPRSIHEGPGPLCDADPGSHRNSPTWSSRFSPFPSPPKATAPVLRKTRDGEQVSSRSPAPLPDPAPGLPSVVGVVEVGQPLTTVDEVLGSEPRPPTHPTPDGGRRGPALGPNALCRAEVELSLTTLGSGGPPTLVSSADALTLSALAVRGVGPTSE